jgi:hypothetical protein
MGFDINIHDQFACESQGPIQDRTRENLGSSDKGIVLYRRLLLDAIRRSEAGEPTLMVIDEQRAGKLTGPPAIDGVGPAEGTEEYWKECDAARRKKAAWAA